ncbi:hypothetical protein AZOA_18060 [Azoarcus sp. Aa7]|nr:hypothetical protein [Azoarcus sp. Aa7]
MGFQVSQWLQRRGDLETVVGHLPELVDEGGGNFPQVIGARFARMRAIDDGVCHAVKTQQFIPNTTGLFESLRDRRQPLDEFE